MARRTIFDMLDAEMNLSEEISRLRVLCGQEVIEGGDDSWCPEYSYTLEKFVDEYCFFRWKHRSRCLDCADMRRKLNITDINMHEELNDEQIITYLEYLANMIWLCDNYLYRDRKFFWSTKYYAELKENFAQILDSMNYEERVFEEEEKVLLVEKNVAVTATAEIVEPQLAYEIIQYNHYMLKGDIEGKRKILNLLAEKIEPMRAKFKTLQRHKELESNVGFLLNKMNIRHNNTEGKNAIDYVKNLSDEELEYWYDEAYQLILLCILEHDNLERNENIAELKKRMA